MSDSSPNPILERRRETNGALWIALVLSIALHVPILFFLPGAVEHDESLEETEFNSAKEFSVSFVEEQDKQKEKDEQRKEELDGQFVSMEPPEEQERPDQARFRDQYDSTAEKEMVRRTPSNNPDAPANSAPDRGGQAANPSPSTNPEARTAAEIRRQNEEQMRRADDRRVDAERDGEPADTPEAREESAEKGDKSESSDPAEAEEGLVQAEDEGEKLKKSVDPKELFPSFADASGVAGGGSTDYMRDIPEGDKNVLNRKSSRYWSFMDRIRRQVQQQWSPVAEYRKRDPTGDVYGVKDKVSILGVTLNGDGSVRKIYVAHPSGLDFYDDEAVRAIRAAAPFHNPPEGIKDQDGLIHFNFLFVLNIDSGGGPLLRIRRQ